MSEDKLPTLTERLWHAALLIFGSVLLIWLAVQLLAQIWGWLLLAAILAGTIAFVVLWMRRKHGGW